MNPNVSDSTSLTESLSYYSDQVDCNEFISLSIAGPFLPNPDVTDSVTVVDSTDHYSDSVDTNESVQFFIFADPYRPTVADIASISDSSDIIRNSSRDIAITDNRIFDETGDFILDETDDFITDEHTSERTRIHELLGFAINPYERSVSDDVTVVESYLVYLPKSFIDVDRLTTTIKVFPISFVLPEGIVIIMIVK